MSLYIPVSVSFSVVQDWTMNEWTNEPLRFAFVCEFWIWICNYVCVICVCVYETEQLNMSNKFFFFFLQFICFIHLNRRLYSSPFFSLPFLLLFCFIFVLRFDIFCFLEICKFRMEQMNWTCLAWHCVKANIHTQHSFVVQTIV